MVFGAKYPHVSSVQITSRILPKTLFCFCCCCCCDLACPKSSLFTVCFHIQVLGFMKRFVVLTEIPVFLKPIFRICFFWILYILKFISSHKFHLVKSQVYLQYFQSSIKIANIFDICSLLIYSVILGQFICLIIMCG